MRSRLGLRKARWLGVSSEWLATHPHADLRATVYRMDALSRLIELGSWGLELRLVVRGAEVVVYPVRCAARSVRLEVGDGGVAGEGGHTSARQATAARP